MAHARKGLGKGLGALIGTGALEVEPAQRIDAFDAPAPSAAAALDDGSRLLLIDPRKVRPNPKQPRHYFDEAALEELAESIRQDGIQEPVIVRERDGEYELVSGERRVRAGIIANLDRVPAVCRDVSDDDMLKLGLIENIQREDLNAIETARAYKQLVEHFDWTQDELARKVGKKRATITNTIRLLNLAVEVQQWVIDGTLTMGHARALLALETPARQIMLARRIVNEKLTVRDAERLSSRPASNAPTAASNSKKDPHIANVEDELRRHLGAKVNIKANAAWKGRIEIDFFNLDELERILDILRS